MICESENIRMKTTEELVVEYQKGDHALVDVIYRRVEKYLRKIGSKFASERNLEVMDCIQESCYGFMKSLDRFDSTKGVKFITVLHISSIGSMNRYHDDKGSSIRIPIYIGGLVRKYRHHKDDLHSRNISHSDEDILDKLRSETAHCISEETYILIKKCAEGEYYNIAELDETVTVKPNEEALCVYDVVPDIMLNKRIDYWTLCEMVYRHISYLDDINADIMCRLYALGKYKKPQSLRNIGRAIGKSGEAIRLRKLSSLKKLRSSIYSNINDRELCEYVL